MTQQRSPGFAFIPNPISSQSRQFAVGCGLVSSHPISCLASAEKSTACGTIPSVFKKKSGSQRHGYIHHRSLLPRSGHSGWLSFLPPPRSRIGVSAFKKCQCDIKIQRHPGWFTSLFTKLPIFSWLFQAILEYARLWMICSLNVPQDLQFIHQEEDLVNRKTSNPGRFIVNRTTSMGGVKINLT